MKNISWPGSFWREKSAVASIEFSLLALPFLLLIFAIIESAISFSVQQLISDRTNTLSKEIKVGSLVGSNLDTKKIKDYICDPHPVFFKLDCGELYVDLRSYNSIKDVPRKLSYKQDGDVDTSGFKVQPGGAGEINQLIVLYKWPILSDLLRGRLSNLPHGKTLLVSTVAWRNEPYK